MSKKGNVKKNVSKQVKKDKQQKGSGFLDSVKKGLEKVFPKAREKQTSDPSNTANQIEIDCSSELLKIKNGKFHRYWEIHQKSYNHTDNKDNNYYIDTFLTKLILDKLLSLIDQALSIEYVGGSNYTQIYTSLPNLFAVEKTDLIEPGTNIRNINTNDLNTFASYQRSSTVLGVNQSTPEMNNDLIIKFPTKVTFELKTKDGNTNFKIPNKEELKKITVNIKSHITNAIEKDYNTYISYKDNENEKEIENKRMENEKKVSEHVQKFQDIFNFDEIDKYKWESLVRSNLPDLNEVTIIINKLIDCEAQKKNNGEIADGGGRTNKKQPKKKILGKIMCIYKIPGDRKEYVRHKGKRITVKDYKESMKTKKAKKPTKLSKKK